MPLRTMDTTDTHPLTDPTMHIKTIEYIVLYPHQPPRLYFNKTDEDGAHCVFLTK